MHTNWSIVVRLSNEIGSSTFVFTEILYTLQSLCSRFWLNSNGCLGLTPFADTAKHTIMVTTAENHGKCWFWHNLTVCAIQTGCGLRSTHTNTSNTISMFDVCRMHRENGIACCGCCGWAYSRVCVCVCVGVMYTRLTRMHFVVNKRDECTAQPRRPNVLKWTRTKPMLTVVFVPAHQCLWWLYSALALTTAECTAGPDRFMCYLLRLSEKRLLVWFVD